MIVELTVGQDLNDLTNPVRFRKLEIRHQLMIIPIKLHMDDIKDVNHNDLIATFTLVALAFQCKNWLNELFNSAASDELKVQFTGRFAFHSFLPYFQ